MRTASILLLGLATALAACDNGGKDGDDGCETVDLEIHVTDATLDPVSGEYTPLEEVEVTITEGVGPNAEETACPHDAGGVYLCSHDGNAQVQLFVFGAPFYQSYSEFVDLEEPSCDPMMIEISLPTESGGL